MTPFDQAYQKLNKNQRQAVDAIEGPVLVLAGPGTGKTQVLAVRIANILKQTDADPNSILALTFTEAAAREMKDRLVKLIGRDGYFVQVTTFHGFCNDVLLSNPEKFSRPAGMQNITELERFQVIKQILEAGSYQYLKPVNDPLYYTPYIISSISTLKREGFTLPRFTELVSILKDELEIEKEKLSKTALLDRQKQLNKNLDLLDIYQNYQDSLKNLGRFDFDDMINWVVDCFESDSDFLLSYQEKFQYLLVDEYQDTNSAQNRLIFALSSFWGQKANVFAVGDPNQSIYRFQGASKENIAHFKISFPDYKKVVLDQNYRSTSTILKLSSGLIGQTPLVPNTTLKDQKLKVAKLSSSQVEDQYLISLVEDKIKSGVSPKDIAVIAKENSDIENLVSLFKKKSLPYRLESGTNVLSTTLVRQFIKLVRVVTTIQDQVDDVDLFIVLNYNYFNLSPFAILKLSREAYTSRSSLVDIFLRLRQEPDNLPKEESQVISFFEKLTYWNSLSAQKSLPETLQIILEESGILNFLLSLPESVSELSRFNSLVEDAKKQSLSFPDLSLKKYLENLNTMEKGDIKISEEAILGNNNAVTLTTAHKSKGQEWQTVFIYRFADTHWGNKIRREMIKLPPGIIVFEDVDKEEDKNSEERRLFYVALTRAKQEIVVTGADQYPNSSKMTFPSIFFEDLPKDSVEVLDTSNFEKNTKETLVSLVTVSGVKKEDSNLEEDYLQELIKNYSLSPTGLNTYLECHYKFKLDHLYKIPKVKSPAMSFGTAVHFALQKLYESMSATNSLPSKNDFLNWFGYALQKEILSPTDYKDRLLHGQKILSEYYDQNQEDFKNALFTEKNFGSSSVSQVYLDDIRLTGKVDRIDLLNKKESKVKLLDYKTGKPKTRNEIEGLTQSSNGSYKRQLVFYALLAELDKSFSYKVSETEINFIEPNEKGEFKKEVFNIATEEIDTLKNTIKESMTSIRSLDFSRTTDLKICDTCPFFSHCWPEK